MTDELPDRNAATEPNPYRLLTTPLAELSNADIAYLCEHKTWIICLLDSPLRRNAIMARAESDRAKLLAAVKEAAGCKHETRVYSKTCAAKICTECDDHQGLDRCWCGWSSTGGNGNAELREMGENMYAEDY